jgi:uncharacterized protein (TIGR02145 family)
MKKAPATIGTLIALLATGLTAQENSKPAPAAPVVGVSSVHPADTVTDIDGNVYRTVTIGNQVWMAENLKTTRYRNGDAIGTTSPATLDISSENTPKYQWAYAGDESNVAIYGRLYTWYAATDSRNIAPIGWHVPTDAEWATLANFLGGESVAGGRLKDIGTTRWKSPNAGATNESGFAGLPGGSRYPDSRGFDLIGRCGHWWAADMEAPGWPWRMLLNYDASYQHMGSSGPTMGWSVRCLRDDPALPSAGLAAEENTKPTKDYLGQALPGDVPEVFARGIVSTDDLEHSAPSFSPDGNEVYWWVNRRPGPDNEEWLSFGMAMRRENGRWSAPCVAPNFLVFSPDGRRAYFDSQRDIWVVEKQGDNWNEPRCLGYTSRFPELKAVFVSSVTRTGTLYCYAGRIEAGGIYRIELVNGEYAKPQLLPQSINQPGSQNITPFIAPDESYLLFSSNRAGSIDDAGDLYISRRLADGSWTDPVSLGEPVNSREQERFPRLSPDGKYLFFTRPTPGHDQDVYWVSAASIPALHPVTNPSQENPK